jgi:NAD(P)H-dependent flavin oxidoreductase YrpB (nitropropane dioxygenase family)
MNGLETSLTSALRIDHPILLAGMAMVASPRLAAAVSNAGGLGVIGAGFPNPSPRRLRKQLTELKKRLDDKTAFGVDLLIPKVGGNARKTNYDYTKGKLDEMIEIICESGCRLFVSAVGVPPRKIVERLHRSGVLVMSMIGSPRHVKKCLDVGVDIICAQGTEGGGHTGDIATMALIPQVVDACAGRNSPLTGKPVMVVAAGGIYDGRTVAAAFSLGAVGVWIGTRFLASVEAATTIRHKNVLLKAKADDTLRTVVCLFLIFFLLHTHTHTHIHTLPDVHRSTSSSLQIIFYLRMGNSTSI